MATSKRFLAASRISYNTLKAKKYVFEKHFEGLPKATDLKIVEEDLPSLKDGEFLSEAVFFSLDPGIRAYSRQFRLGTTFVGSQIAKIIESKNSKYHVGNYVVGPFGWRTHTISDGHSNSDSLSIGTRGVWSIPDHGELPLSLSLGVLGVPGNTAYFGFLEICKPKPGDTVVVTGAAGAVGSHVGQIAKIKGCKVVGIAGSHEKGEWLINDLKFDHFINYKTENISKKLAEVTPDGIDCYFDNVGGDISSLIINKMNLFGRVSVCGAISGYNDKEAARARTVQPGMVSKQLKMEGFVVHRWDDRWFEGIQQNKKWIQEGKLKYRETVTEGFENLLNAFVDMLQGGNIGKAIVKV